MACTPSIATAGKEGQKKSTPAPLIALAHCRAGSDDPEPKPKRVEVLKGHGGKVRGLEFHPTEPLLFSCGDDAQLICHDFDGVSKRTKAIREISRKKVGDKTVAIKFDASGRVLAASGVTRWGNGFGAGLRIFIDGIEKPFVVGAPTEWNYTSCDVSPEGSYVVMGGTQNLLRVASLLPKTNKKGNLEPSLIRKDAPGIPDSVRRVACHPSKPVLAAGGKGGWIYTYEVTLDGLIRIPKLTEIHRADHELRIMGLKFCPKGKHLVACSQDGNIRVYSTATGKKIKDWRPTKVTTHWLDIHPVYPWIVVGYSDGFARIIDYQNKTVLSELKDQEDLLKP